MTIRSITHAPAHSLPEIPGWMADCRVCRIRVVVWRKLFWAVRTETGVRQRNKSAEVLAEHIAVSHPEQVPAYDLDCGNCITYGTQVSAFTPVLLDRAHRAEHLFKTPADARS
ncbi:hypothetical protein [Streptomyces sp. NPDC056883]|uniref:hypothetical protein n=1 Tax=Streptomyces sp. NPDC056883 TaxID=3345959 RepID=UPI0036B239F1